MLEKTYSNIEHTTFTNKQWAFLNDLEDQEYRKLFPEDLLGAFLALQIRTLREANGWTQKEFESIAGKKQPTISQWEDPNYGKYSLSTLKHLAKAFDVGLLVRFVSFSELANWVVDVDPNRLCPASYEEEARQLSFSETGGEDWTYPSNIEVMVITGDLEQWPQPLPALSQTGFSDSSSAVAAKVSAYEVAA